jgi:hypothetical protein
MITVAFATLTARREGIALDAALLRAVSVLFGGRLAVCVLLVAKHQRQVPPLE